MIWIFIIMTFVPLIFAPRTFFNGFALPQTFALGLLSSVGILLGMGQGSFSFDPASGLCILFILYLIISFIKTEPIHNGRKELGLQLPLCLVFLLSVSFLTSDSIKWLALSSTIATILCSIYARFQTLEVDPFFPNSRKAGGPITNAIGTIGNPNFLASYLCVAIWPIIYCVLEFDKILIIAAGFVLYMLIKTGSRAGLLGFIASVWFFILICACYEKIPVTYNDVVFHGGLAMTMFGLLIIFLLFKINWQTFFYSKIDPQGDQIWYASFRYRLCYWMSAWEIFKKKPIFGWGLWSFRREVYGAQANINDRNPSFLEPDRYLTPQPREVHNDFLEHLVEFGIVGTTIFLCFLGVIFYSGFEYLSIAIGTDFFRMLILLSGLTAVVVDAIFFFALRLPTTGILFWLLCGMIIIKSGNIATYSFQSSWMIMIVVALMLGFFLWECIGKRCLASYHFLRSSTSSNPAAKTRSLIAALKYAPNDTILRTYATIVNLDFEPTIANIHAWKVLEHYDGMTPLQTALFNVGLAITRITNIYDHAEMLFKNSHYILPTFKPTLDLLNSKYGVGSRSKYKGGRALMRLADEGSLWKVRALLGEIERNKLNLQLYELRKEKEVVERETLNTQIQLAISQLEKTLVLEKKRLNIPDHWPFDPEKGEFLDPNEMSDKDKQRLGVVTNPTQ